MSQTPRDFWDGVMPDSDKLRDRATRLFTLTLKARETGFATAAELEKLASVALAQAEDMERRTATPPRPAAPQQTAQQQQQPQPKKDEK
jgi:hypothetical protein